VPVVHIEALAGTAALATVTGTAELASPHAMPMR
jgi:hypothetical protein